MNFKIINQFTGSIWLLFLTTLLPLALNAQKHHLSSFEKFKIRAYFFSDGSLADSKNNKNAIDHDGSLVYIKDRNDQDNNAIQFGDESYISLPNLFEGADISQGFTMTFWIKVDDPLDSREGSDYPFTGNDDEDQIIYGKTEDGTTRFGIKRIRDRIAYTRTVNDQPFDLWFWDPANLDSSSESGSSWHFVAFVQGTNFSRIFIGKPNSGEVECRANYLPIQDYDDIVNFGIGNPSGNSIFAIDDFEVYATAMTESQVITKYGHDLNKTLKPRIDASNTWGASSNIARSSSSGNTILTTTDKTLLTGGAFIGGVLGIYAGYKGYKFFTRSSRGSSTPSERVRLTEICEED